MIIFQKAFITTGCTSSLVIYCDHFRLGDHLFQGFQLGIETEVFSAFLFPSLTKVSTTVLAGAKYGHNRE